jgi:hypothetical protein
MKLELLRTVDDIIDAFGGTTVVARWLGIGHSAVSNWRKDQAIPNGWHLRFYLAAQDLGYRIDPRLFGAHVWPSLRAFRGPDGHDSHVA